LRSTVCYLIQDADFAGIPLLPEAAKLPFRALAEVLLHAFMAQRPHMLESLHVVRASEDLLVDLHTLGVIRDAAPPGSRKQPRWLVRT
jgi:hypothetical protein